MLTKLLQYEAKATARVLLPVYGGVLALCLLTGICDRLNVPLTDLPGVLGWLGAILALLTVLALVFVLGACVFVNVQRFYKLLGEQGYLLLSLPVPAWKHIAAKLLCACAWLIVTFPFLFLCGDVMSGRFGELSIIWPEATPVVVAQTLLGLLLLVLAAAVAYLQFYLSCAIGAQFGQQRLLASIVSYFVLGFIEQILFLILMTSLAFAAYQNQTFWVERLADSIATPEIASIVLLGAADILLLLVAAIHWAVTQWLITRRLNLA